jgi:lysophospholipid acyltransferase (LPLAT)-like uncharacterized protein
MIALSSIYKNIKAWVVALLFWILYSLIRLTWRYEEILEPKEILDRAKKNKPVVYGHLHGDEWGLLGFFSYQKVGVLASRSKDGSAMANLLWLLGYAVHRGSSSRGGASGLLGLVKTGKKLNSQKLSLAIDGPRGPRGKVKRGIVALSEHLNAPIVMLAAHATNSWVFKKSWSQAFLPKPFSTIYITYAKAENWQNLDSHENATKILEAALIKAKTMAQEFSQETK